MAPGGGGRVRKARNRSSQKRARGDIPVLDTSGRNALGDTGDSGDKSDKDDIKAGETENDLPPELSVGIRTRAGKGQVHYGSRLRTFGSSSSMSSSGESFKSGRPRRLSFAPTSTPNVLVENARQIRRLCFLCFSLILIYDACYNALGATNGKFISLVDTVQNVGSVRAKLPLVPAAVANSSGSAYFGNRRGATVRRVLWVLMISFVIKFGSQTLLSYLLGEIPVFLKGPRHVLSFGFGFILVWFSPGDVVFRSMTKSLSTKLLLSVSGGLYRLRKALFALEAGLALQPWPNPDDPDRMWTSLRSAGFVGAMVLIALDGNSVVRKLIIFFENLTADIVDRDVANDEDDRFDSTLDSGPLARVASAFRIFRDGLRAVVSDYIFPDLVVATALLLLDGKNFMELRIGLLLYNCDKAGTFEILETIHSVGMAARTPTHRRPADLSPADLSPSLAEPGSSATALVRKKEH